MSQPSENILETLSIKYPKYAGLFVETTQLWYKKYSYKVHFKNRLCICYRNLFEEQTVFSNTIKCENEIVEYKLLFSAAPTLYFNNNVLLKKIYDKYDAEHINTIHAPKSSNIVDLLKQNTTVKIKRKYYFDNYKYKAVLYGYKSKSSDIYKWIIDLYCSDDDVKNRNHIYFNYPLSFRNLKIWYRPKQNNPTIFFKEEEDLILFKLSWSEFIQSIESVKLMEK